MAVLGRSRRVAIASIGLSVALAGCATRPAPATTAAVSAPAHVSGVDAGDVVRAVVERSGVPGMAAVVLRGDHVIAHGAAGVRRRGSSEPVTLSDHFELCSATKAMTATVAARLVETGTLSWGTTLGEILGADDPQMDPQWHDVTLRQLLAQSAGLADRPADFLGASRRAGGLTAQRADYARRVLRRPPAYTPGSRGVYANTNYLVAAAMLERVSARSWEDLVERELFQPLGITSGGFGPPGSGRTLDQPWGHGARRLFFVPLPGASTIPFAPSDPSADFPRLAGPAGMVHLSLPDWARFVSMHLRGDPANPHAGSDLLAPATIAELHRAESLEFREKPSGAPLRDTGYALGWFVATRSWANGGRPGDNGRVIYHLGENGRWTCAVWVAPELDLAILVACNRGRAWGPVDEAVGGLLRRFKHAAP